MKALKKSIGIIYTVLLVHFVNAQELHPRCGFSRDLKEAAIFEEKLQELQRGKETARSTAETIQIPVIVHIIHNNKAGIVGGSSNNGNIAIAQIESQIQVLNEDFRRKQGSLGFNSSPVGADMNIEFVLMGITRTYSPRLEFNAELETDRLEMANLGEIDKTPADKYLNIFLAKLQWPTLGYTEFPSLNGVDGLATTGESRKKIDATFIDHHSFGKKTGTVVDPLYDAGRTTTHEIGHWLGLLHTWGDTFYGTDYCNDTPPAEKKNLLSVNTCNPVFSECFAGKRTQNMIENYMDYSPDKCMNIFTQDQKKRVDAVLSLAPRRFSMVQNSRFSTIITATGNSKITGFEFDIIPNPSSKIINIELDFQGAKNINIDLLSSDGNQIMSKTWNDQIAGRLEIPTENTSDGFYFIQVSIGTEKQLKKVFIQN